MLNCAFGTSGILPAVVGPSAGAGERRASMFRMEWGLLGSLAEADRRAVLSRCRRRRFGRHEAIFREGDVGDSVHFLSKGTVAVQVSTPLGDVATLSVLGAGDAFGEQALVGVVSERSATVVTLEPVETMRLGRNDFAAVVEDHPETAHLLVAMLDARLRATSQSLVDALYLSADVRVYKRLASLAHFSHGSASREIWVTQEDLATMAGTTRQTVNKVLRDAEADGLLRLARGRIEILDLGILACRAR